MILSRRGRCLLSGASVLSLYVSAMLFPEGLLFVLAGIIVIWGIISPSHGFLILFPSLIPFMNVEIAGIRGASLVSIFTIAIFLILLLKPREFVQRVHSIPNYAMFGIVWLLAIEIISGLMFSPSPLAHIAVLTRLTRSIQFVVVAALATQLASLAVIEAGWIYYGILQVTAAIILQTRFGNVLAVRESESFSLGGLVPVSIVIASIGFMAIASFWFSASMASRRKGTKRILLWVLAILCIGAAFFSGRRQALLAVIISVALAGIVARSWKRIGILALMFVVLIGLYYGGPLRDFLSGRQSLFDEIMGNRGGQYWRINEAGFEAFRSSPVFGIGLGNYTSATSEFGVARRYGEWATPHNSLVRILAETGLIGLIGFLVISIGFFYNMIRLIWKLRKSTSLGPMHFVLGASSLVLTGFAVTILDQPEYIFLFGQIIGLMAAFNRGALSGSQRQHLAARGAK